MEVLTYPNRCLETLFSQSWHMLRPFRLLVGFLGMPGRGFETISATHKTNEPTLNIDCDCYRLHLYVDCIRRRNEVPRRAGLVVFRARRPAMLWMQAHLFECEDRLFSNMLQVHNDQGSCWAQP